jgi:diguanylate cyclase (GGDEF)-like protein
MHRWIFETSRRSWTVFTVVMLLLLLVMSWLWWQQFKNNFEEVKSATDHKVALLASITAETLRRGQYQNIEEIVTSWGQSDIREESISVTAKNGTVIASFKRANPADHAIEISLPIEYTYHGQATLLLRRDLDDIYDQSRMFGYQLALTYALLGLLLAIVTNMARLINREACILRKKTVQLNKVNKALKEENVERKHAEEQVHYLAFYDELTLLPNRRMFTDRLQRAMAASSRSMEFAVLLFIDLDHFKTLNDTHGHNYGDLMLIDVALRLIDCVRDVDTVARLGGDEFVVLVEGLNQNRELAAEQALLIGEKIRESVSRPYKLEGIEVHRSASSGSSLFCGETIKLDDLFRHADSAMYQAKDAGRNSLRFFDPIMQHELEFRTKLEADLRYALTRQQLSLYYQKQVDAQGNVIGAEVLLRWKHPQEGMISPVKFIPIAEHAGLIESIGVWVLQTACKQIKSWNGDPHTAHLDLSINVSARQFRGANFVREVIETIQNADIEPHRIKLELTEGLMLDNIQNSIIKMQALRDFGVRISVDDFGTGQSSLAYLRRLPLDQIKIDQSFMRDIPANQSDAAIVKIIIMMANNLGIEVIAEGVETEHQLDFLRLNGCYLYQGYLFGKPVPIDEFLLVHGVIDV